MVLYFIGIGLNDPKDITVKGLETIKRCDHIYIDAYTSKLNCTHEELEEFYGKRVVLADRELVEQKAEDSILKNAKDKNVAFLVVGDIFGATTHMDLRLRAHKLGIKTKFIHNASILTAVGIVGLELYKYGKTTSIVFPEEGFRPETPYDVIKMNKANGLHTLCLLDIKMKEPFKEDIRHGKDEPQPPRFMSVNQAIETLLEIEEKRKENIFTKETLCIGCARLGSDNPAIKVGTAEKLLKHDFGAEMHCLIVPGKLHFIEEEALILYS